MTLDTLYILLDLWFLTCGRINMHLSISSLPHKLPYSDVCSTCYVSSLLKIVVVFWPQGSGPLSAQFMSLTCGMLAKKEAHKKAMEFFFFYMNMIRWKLFPKIQNTMIVNQFYDNGSLMYSRFYPQFPLEFSTFINQRKCKK
jgi:hypothetical protein